MNGFTLVLLGVVLFVVGYALWKIQGKLKDVTLAVDSGFKSIEDGITQNLLVQMEPSQKQQTQLTKIT